MAEDVERPGLRVGALATVAGGASEDDTRVRLRELPVADAEALGDAGPEVRQEDVRVAGQAKQHVAALGVLEIQGQRALPSVERLEIAAEAELR